MIEAWFKCQQCGKEFSKTADGEQAIRKLQDEINKPATCKECVESWSWGYE
jgi:DNA-directed RNA polymerase subunit RPC12/RpoP